MKLIKMEDQKIHLGGRMFLSPKELLYLEAQENYTLIHLTCGRKHLVATTLGKLESQLERFGFVRASRSTLVNTEEILASHAQKDVLYLKLSNNYTVDVSRRRKKIVLEALA
jgi:DNA-binding LytR/AlgR family response regulator